MQRRGGEQERRRRAGWAWWLPGGWTLWTETSLVSLAVHLALAIVAAMITLRPPRSSQVELVFLQINAPEPPKTMAASAAISASVSPADADPKDPASAATASSVSGGAAAKPGDAAPAIAMDLPGQRADARPSEWSETMALIGQLQRRYDDAPAEGKRLADALKAVGGGRPAIRAANDEAALRAADAEIPREPIPTGPTAPLSLFGAAAEGRSFVLVIDRSASMGAEGLGVMSIAARELADQLGTLTSEQTVQVVAYNQAILQLPGRGMVPASEENRAQLVRFVADLAAFGQTDHTRGLLAALKLKPEVIYLFTDGGEPQPDPAQLRIIRDAAGRTSIHCLHFGRGPAGDSSGARFLKQLARENAGCYIYIDVNRR